MSAMSLPRKSSEVGVERSLVELVALQPEPRSGGGAGRVPVLVWPKRTIVQRPPGHVPCELSAGRRAGRSGQRSCRAV